MAAWLDSMARARADSVTLQKWWHHTASGDSISMTNVLAQFNLKATERVLYLAHWDTRPRADQDATDKNSPIPGADDGGSGVAVLLGVADALKKLPPTVGVDLLFVDGEDYGMFGPPRVDVLIGAAYYAQHPVAGARPFSRCSWTWSGTRTCGFRSRKTRRLLPPTWWTGSGARRSAWGTDTSSSRTPTGGITDDHIPLIDAGIRTIDVIDISNYPYWHTMQDTPDKESAQSLEAVGNVAVGVIRGAGKK